MMVSSKSVLIGSQPKDVKDIAKELRKLNIPIQAVMEAVDLGIDTAAGRKRITRKAEQRRQKAKKRLANIIRLRRVAAPQRESTGLWNTGAIPQAVYGHQAFGMAIHELQRLRRQAGQVAGGKTKGRCLAPTLAVEMWKSDPAITIRTSIIKEWISVWQRFP